MRCVGPAAAGAELGTRVVLDVRGEAAFGAGHLPGSGHLPIGALAERRAELPPRERALLVVGSDGGEAVVAANVLESMGYADVIALDGPIECLADGLADRGPAARLWRPAPFLELALDRFGVDLPAGPAADIAAGAGRDSVYLGLRGFEVEAFDHDAGALARAASLAARHGVTFAAVECDLEWKEVSLPRSRYAVVVCFRFLHRPLFPSLAAALLPGGILIYETYRVGQERFGRPKQRRFLLESGELAGAFSELDSLHYEETEPPEGPITARLVARRPCTETGPATEPGRSAASKPKPRP